MDGLTIVVPFRNGHDVIHRLLASLPPGIPTLIVDDVSDVPLRVNKENVRVQRLKERGYFSGAVNAGLSACTTDVLVLNQDAELRNLDTLMPRLITARKANALFGDGVFGHPVWPKGYVQGTFMYLRRDAYDVVGGLNADEYPLWGSTCELQLRIARAGFKVAPSKEWSEWLSHGYRRETVNIGQVGQTQFGTSIAEAIRREPDKVRLFTRTPPAVSVIVPCYNYGEYLPDAINSLLGGNTSLGQMSPQTLQSFDIIIVDDASTDGSWKVARSLADSFKGIRAYRLSENRGLPAALNHGIARSRAEYITILSADDMRESWALERAYRTCRKDPGAVAYGDIQTFSAGERKRVMPLPKYDFNTMLSKNMMPAGIMFSREAWQKTGGYPEGMKWGREDWAFNIALGVQGYCGVHTGNSGNLYRRDGQNRSRRTANIHRGEKAVSSNFRWPRYFREQLRVLFPRIFAGERPMGCCGGRGGRGTKTRSAARSMAAKVLPGNDGMVQLEFIGAGLGNGTYYGEATGTPYRFGNSDLRRLGFVAAKDAKGLLDMMKNKSPLFRKFSGRRAPLPAPPVEALEIAQPESNTDRFSDLEIDATDAARELAVVNGFDLSLVPGTGKDGRITVGDVRSYGSSD